MALICDTSGIFALYDADDAHHEAIIAVVAAEPGPLFIPVILLAEIDYLLTVRLGIAAAIDFTDAVAQGEFTLVPLTTSDLARCRELMVEYRDLEIGLADATIVAAAERLGMPRLLPLDQRHFRTIKPGTFSHFVILPADARID
ncbi:MAG: PIN domain-containing protein [Planctomycetes bacterium]|nr:PIN domain-containing protein [Planctomycetota bacterium]